MTKIIKPSHTTPVSALCEQANDLDSYLFRMYSHSTGVYFLVIGPRLTLKLKKLVSPIWIISPDRKAI